MRKGFMQSLDLFKYFTSQSLHPRFYDICNPRNRSFLCEEVSWTANGEEKENLVGKESKWFIF